jgi:hypothetical protein
MGVIEREQSQPLHVETSLQREERPRRDPEPRPLLDSGVRQRHDLPHGAVVSGERPANLQWVA